MVPGAAGPVDLCLLLQPAEDDNEDELFLMPPGRFCCWLLLTELCAVVVAAEESEHTDNVVVSLIRLVRLVDFKPPTPLQTPLQPPLPLGAIKLGCRSAPVAEVGRAGLDEVFICNGRLCFLSPFDDLLVVCALCSMLILVELDVFDEGAFGVRELMLAWSIFC